MKILYKMLQIAFYASIFLMFISFVTEQFKLHFIFNLPNLSLTFLLITPIASVLFLSVYYLFKRDFRTSSVAFLLFVILILNIIFI